MSVNIGNRNGVSEELLDQQGEQLTHALSALRKKWETGELGFFDLYKTAPLDEILNFVQETSADFDDIVVVGIGGSSLGNRALHQALNHPLDLEGRKVPRIHICDNIDPDSVSAILYQINNLNCSQFQIITKSGSTAETLANFMIFYQALKKEHINPKKHIVAITDPNSGDLLKLARQEGFKSFVVPPNVGGRFSVLTAVGLLSVAYTAVDIEAILKGAQEMSERCWNGNFRENPAAILAFLLTYLCDSRGKSDVIFMPYSASLKSFALWFCQLWAESLGKEGKGQTPVATEGAADQHSQLQLYMEGPENKVILFLRVEKPRSDCPLNCDLSADSIDYLKGKTLNELFLAEHLATATALAQRGRPNLTLTIERVDEKSLGALIYLFEFATAIAGEFWGINAFDQPGVEEGKRLTYAMMNRKGYAEKRKELEKWQQQLKPFEC
jgi:glucose-6-phosphate isomerase